MGIAKLLDEMALEYYKIYGKDPDVVRMNYYVFKQFLREMIGGDPEDVKVMEAEYRGLKIVVDRVNFISI